MTTRHPGETRGFLSHPAHGAEAGPAPFLGDVSDGIAVVGPALARRPVMRRLAAEAIAAGTSVTLLSLGPDSGLADAVASEATDAPQGIAVVDMDAAPSRTHRLDPFCDVDAPGLSRLLLSGSGILPGATPDAARARMLVDALAAAFVSLRDLGLLDVSGRRILDHLDVRKVIDLCDPDAYPQIATGIRSDIARYLDGLPGFRSDRKYKQAQSVLDAHAPVVLAIMDALTPFLQARGAAVSACAVADLALSDIGVPGRHAVLRAGNAPGSEFAPAFLAACLAEGLRIRTGDAPALVILDGVECLHAHWLHRIPGLLGQGVSLAVGMPDLRSDARLALSLELGARLLLPAAGRVGLDPLRPSEAERALHDACLAGWRGLLFREDVTKTVELPRDSRPPQRGPVPERSRGTSRQVVDPSSAAPAEAVLTRLLEPGATPSAGVGDPVIDALARSFSGRPAAASLDDAARDALDEVARGGSPTGRD